MKAKKMNMEDILDELCYCGALKSEHGGLNGHGSCGRTDCKQYTWKQFIFKTKEDKKKDKEGPKNYAVMVDNCITQFSGGSRITYTKETAKQISEILGGKVVQIEITEVVE